MDKQERTFQYYNIYFFINTNSKDEKNKFEVDIKNNANNKINDTFQNKKRRRDSSEEEDEIKIVK